MKTLFINPFIWVRTFFYSFAGKKSTLAIHYRKKETPLYKMTPTVKSNATENNSKQVDMAKFQRKAHVGNFFAGPTCVFNPKLFA